VLINIYLPSVSLPKLSALCFYLRVFVYRKGRIFAYITIGLVILNWVVFSITSIFQCRPIAYWWDKTIQGGVCLDFQIYYPAMFVPNIVTDVIVLLLPISSLIQLKLPLLKKIACVSSFLPPACGFLRVPMSVLFQRKLIFPYRGMFASIYRFSLVLTTNISTNQTCKMPPIKLWNICTRLTCSKKRGPNRVVYRGERHVFNRRLSTLIATCRRKGQPKEIEGDIQSPIIKII
jgi:rhodopsin domain-containing protein